MTSARQYQLGNLDIGRLRAAAARSGWLIESSEWLRAGLGAVVRSFEIADWSEPDIAQSFFADLEFVREPSAPVPCGPVCFVSVPFSHTTPLRAWIPEHTIHVDASGTAWLASFAESPLEAVERLVGHADGDLDVEYEVVAATFTPSPDGYARAVAAAVEEMRHSELDKVVLARRVVGRTAGDIDPAVVVARLHAREPACTLYAVPSLGAGRFVGASPELLVASIDGSVEAHPLAGTVALHDESDSQDYATWLLGSSKNLFEHRVVVDDIVARLERCCEDVRAERVPSIVTLRSVAHLGTWIHGKIATPTRSTAFELLILLHPTPAVGGIPQEHALGVIRRLEPVDRGLYAGAVGWLDDRGNGEWWIAIRGIEVDGDIFTAWAGAGIVADSDPIAEREETRDKLASILVGLGRPPTS